MGSLYAKGGNKAVIDAEKSIQTYAREAKESAEESKNYSESSHQSYVAADHARQEAQETVKNAVTKDYLESDEARWKQYARGEAEMLAMISANKALYAASGFVDFGKHLTDTATRFSINEGLYSIAEVGTQNTLFSGRKGSAQQGTSKTNAPVVHHAGVISKLDSGDPNNALEIKFKEAPDGRDTFDKSTGAIVRHATVQAAFASAAANQNIEVLIDRHDVFGGESWLEIVSTANPFVYRYGQIHSKAASMNGITTKRSNRPSTYYAAFDGDTTSDGLGVDFWAATPEQKISMLSDQENNLFLVKDEYGVDAIVQWRDRDLTFTGVANGSPVDIDPEGGNVLRMAGSVRPSPQGYRDTPNVSQGSSFFAASNFSQYNPHQELGLFTATSASATGFLNHCYFMVWGSVRHLNQGAYHPSHNVLGAAAFAWRDSSNGQVEWHSNVKAKNPTNTEDCFKLSTDGGSKSTNPTTGKIQDAFKARPDERKYDGIYPGGDGGVNDERVTAWDAGSPEEAAKIFIKLLNGTYRGEEESIQTKVMVETQLTASTTAKAVSIPLGEAANYKAGDVISVYDAVTGNIVIKEQIISGSGTDSGGTVDFLSWSSSNVQQKFNRLVQPYYTIASRKTGSKVSGEFTILDVAGKPDILLSNPNFANGWQGYWVPFIISNGANTFQVVRKSLVANADNNFYSSGTWYPSNAPINTTTNEITLNYTNVDAEFSAYSYTAFAKQTKIASNESILNFVKGLGGVYVGSDNRANVGCLLGESLLGKVLTDNVSGRRYSHLELDQIELFPDTGAIIESNNFQPTHSKIIKKAPTNNSPAIKLLWHQTALNQKCGLNFLWNEMAFSDMGALNPVDSGSPQTYSKGGLYRVAVGSQHLGLVVQCVDTVTLQLDQYARGDDGMFYRNSDGAVLSQLKLWDGSGWGDNGLIEVGNGSYTNENGVTCAYGIHKLTNRYGYTKNRARAGVQVPGVDL